MTKQSSQIEGLTEVSNFNDQRETLNDRSDIMKTPTGLKYSKTDEWVKLEGEEALIGITDYAQDQLSDVVYVDLMVEEDDEVSKGDTIATVESVKAAADVNFPASGTILAVNEHLADNPEVLNSDPYEAGWMVKIKLDDPSELEELMDAEAYEAYNAEREG
jgi:glycine cleavage system H protein